MTVITPFQTLNVLGPPCLIRLILRNTLTLHYSFESNIEVNIFIFRVPINYPYFKLVHKWAKNDYQIYLFYSINSKYSSIILNMFLQLSSKVFKVEFWMVLNSQCSMRGGQMLFLTWRQWDLYAPCAFCNIYLICADT